jgi:hypothetical protein
MLDEATLRELKERLPELMCHFVDSDSLIGFVCLFCEQNAETEDDIVHLDNCLGKRLEAMPCGS